MTMHLYTPTEEQQDVINHIGAAFVTACPGAGKTRTMVERTRRLLEDPNDRRGIAFLSFTNAAVAELETRLGTFGVLPTPLFPSFIGTFDRFLWQFLISPFGIDGCDVAPKLIPDKNSWEVKPYDDAQALSLKCFDRSTGRAIPALSKDEGFDVENRNIKAHETQALAIISKAKREGLVDFEDVRVCVQGRLSNIAFASRLGSALSARFREVVVDEAQDCNPDDLLIVDWLRRSGIAVKVICDPHQSIYKFRGGVTDELEKFATTFDAKDRLSMSGNFRSSPAICSAIVALRPPNARANPDKPLGQHKCDATPVHIISYAGSGVPATIGSTFSELVISKGISLSDAPMLAATRGSAAKAIGQPILDQTTHMTLLLAEATMNYHFSFAIGGRRDALVKLHRIVLLIQGRIKTLGDYRAYLMSEGLEDGRWRPKLIALANELSFNPTDTSDRWLERSRTLIKDGLVGVSSINQRLKAHSNLVKALTGAPTNSCQARTIHSAKGMEFSAVCVVLTSRSAGKIIEFLEGSVSTGAEEDARKIYVAASRAQRLLAFAVPQSRAQRLQAILAAHGCAVTVQKI